MGTGDGTEDANPAHPRRLNVLFDHQRTAVCSRPDLSLGPRNRRREWIRHFFSNGRRSGHTLLVVFAATGWFRYRLRNRTEDPPSPLANPFILGPRVEAEA